jgi:hypothetical protein
MSSQVGSPLGLLPLTSNSKVAERLEYSMQPNINYQATLHNFQSSKYLQGKSSLFKCDLLQYRIPTLSVTFALLYLKQYDRDIQELNVQADGSASATAVSLNF